MERRRFAAPEFILGEGALELAGQYATSLPAKKLLLVTEPGVIKAGWVEKVEFSLVEADLKSLAWRAANDPCLVTNSTRPARHRKAL